MEQSDAKSSLETKYPKLVLNAWHGMPWGAIRRIMRQNGGSFSWRRTDRTITILYAAAHNSLLNSIDRLVYRRRTKAAQLEHSPLFILGHWRTGTTLLHELLIRDRQFNYPTTYQCFAPGHFLLTERVLPSLLRIVLPPQRPMDNMPVGWRRPQEDEFALANQGIPSPYLFWVYPDRPCPYDHYLELSGLSPAELEAWKNGLLEFLKRVALRDRRTLVLKSPTHTARVKTLLELFPRAKFIYLARDPQMMIPSTILTWRRLGEVMGIRREIRGDLSDYVLDNFKRMDRAYQAQRELIPAGQLFETRYEDLTADMLGTVQQMYRQLSLGDFANIRPHLEEYMRENKNYRKNRFASDPESAQAIDAACGDYARRHGYAKKTQGGAA